MKNVLTYVLMNIKWILQYMDRMKNVPTYEIMDNQLKPNLQSTSQFTPTTSVNWI